ncbi:uncharacterized protein LOC110875791 [Helianthus annuus]|uniref:uncharacterized protein LOC110875791 n=1 Tax=Helianthus annuus TaxID=4232 RepID=UPI000B8F4DF7|nr:uncharacterized protein LOC110875791 [Helianthus annuus]
MYVEYEWYPNRCFKCCVFGHSVETCPQTPKKPANVKRVAQNDKVQVHENRYAKKYPVIDEDGYQGVPSRKVARKQGFQVNKQKAKFEYRPVSAKPKGEVKKDSSSSGVESKNPFAALNDIEDDGVGDSDSEEVVEVYNETNDFMLQNSKKPNDKQGASTPSPVGSNESHVDIHNLNKVCSSVFRRWEWTSNGSSCQKGTRIIAGWDPGIFYVILLAQSSQVMHFQIIFKQDKKLLFCSVVYAANYYITRRELWQHLSKHKVLVGNNPWVILGDFNSALNLDDKSMGASNISPGMREFQECVLDIEVFDINSSGMHFTWNQKPKEGVGLLKKIDRIMGNTPFVDIFPNSVAFFHPNRLSDHCPCLLKIPATEKRKHQSFKFANFLVYKPGFIEAVKKVWDNNVEGVQQFQLVKKLRILKRPLRALLFQQGNLHKKVETLRGELDAIQREIDRSPFNLILHDQESRITAEFQEACLDEERFLKQKSKVDWLRAGDSNTAFFHASLKSRNHATRIEVIMNSEGEMFEGDNVSKAFVTHYEKFHGSEDDLVLRPSYDLFSNKLNANDSIYMIRPVTCEEVR